MKTMYIRYDGWTPSALGDAVSGQVNTLRCSFAFSADWDAYQNRKAIFETDEARKEESLDENGSCLIPRAVLMKRGKLKISAYGTETGENGELLRYNGRPAEIIVDLGGNVDGESTDDPVYPQIGEAVMYTAQSLTEAQQAQARANIGAGTPYTLPQASQDELGGVKADAVKETDTQPVRKGTDGKLYTAPGGSGEAVLYTAQSLTEEQQAQARANIDVLQPDYTQNDATKPDYIKNRPGGYLGEQKTYKLDISAVKQDGIDELTNVSVLQDDFMHVSSINVEISHSSGTINRTLTQRHIPEYVINTYGAQIYGNAHLINPSQPDTGEDMALYKETDSSSNYSVGWHVWATSVPSGNVEVCVVEKTRSAVRFDPEFIPWYGSPTKDAVLYTAQSLTEAQQAQARANIGAGTPYTLPNASSDALGGVKADSAEATDTQPVRIGGDGKLYTAPGGGGADISLGISGATAGQMAKVKTVDASGAPTAWEAGDAAGGGSEWTKLGDVTVSQTAEFVPLSFSNGIVTIDTNADGYASLPSSGTIDCIVHTIDVTSKANPIVGILKPKNYEAGTFEFYNRDKVFQSSAAYDPTTYKISIRNVAMVVLGNIPSNYKRYKSRITTPLYSNHGLRVRYACDGFTEIGCAANQSANMGGGAIIETEFYPHPYDENYVYRRVRIAYGKFYDGGSGNEFQSFELISSGSGKTKPQESGAISFKAINMIFVNGTRFELWGTNDD